MPAPAPAPHFTYPAQVPAHPPFYQHPSQSSTPIPPAPAPAFDLAALLQSASSATSTPPPSLPSAPQQPSVAPSSSLLPSDLLQNLINAGIITMPAATQESTATEAIPVKQEDAGAASRNQEYDDMILGMGVQLTSASIQRYVPNSLYTCERSLTNFYRERPQMASMLYNRLPLQCKQCAMRFPAGEAGKKTMEDHLDLHFKQNRKASQNTGRGHSRSWFIAREVSCTSIPSFETSC